jgi:hypothetical protein
MADFTCRQRDVSPQPSGLLPYRTPRVGPLAVTRAEPAELVCAGYVP